MFGDLPETGRVDKTISPSQELLALSWWYFPTFNDQSADFCGNPVMTVKSILEEAAWRHSFDR